MGTLLYHPVRGNSRYWPAIDISFTLKARPQLCSDQLLSLTGRTELLLEATPVFEAASWGFFSPCIQYIRGGRGFETLSLESVQRCVIPQRQSLNADERTPDTSVVFFFLSICQFCVYWILNKAALAMIHHRWYSEEKLRIQGPIMSKGAELRESAVPHYRQASG